MQDVTAAYLRDNGMPPEAVAYLPLLESCLEGESAIAAAERLYRRAIDIEPALAEAWYNLGRLFQLREEWARALESFERASSMPPHQRAQAHAHLHANAHWQLAAVYEKLGRDEDSLRHYREATSRLDSFGVHQGAGAALLRRRGLMEEAIQQYNMLMQYGHRYFTEFTLPPLQAEKAALDVSARPLEVLYETSDGASIVCWDAQYYRVQNDMLPLTASDLMMIVAAEDRGRLKNRYIRKIMRIFDKIVPGRRIRYAPSMASLER